MDRGKQWRAILVGCGSISNAWLQLLVGRGDVQLAGLVDVVPSRAEAQRLAYQLEHSQVGADLALMLQQLKPDLLFDCTVPEAHESVTTLALQHGCHVMGEKPLATNMASAKRMLRAATESGQVYAVMQNRRYLNGVVRLRDFIRSGAIGQLTTLNGDFYLGPHFGGFREEMAHVLLMDMAIHSFDQARFVTGCDPSSVYCHEWNPAGSWYRHGASAMAIFEMEDGLVFNYRGSWCAYGLPTSWECEWRAVGTQGSVWWDGHDTFRAERTSGTGGFLPTAEVIEVPTPAPLPFTGHQGAIGDFLDCLNADRQPPTHVVDNIKSLAMVLSAIDSAESKTKAMIEV